MSVALLSSFRIVAGQVTLQAMGFQARFFPDPMHRVLADSQCARQFAATPMEWNRRWVSCGWPTECGPGSRVRHRGLLAGMIGVEPVELPVSRKRCFQRMIVGALVCNLRLMVLKEVPSASIKMSLARKT